MFVGRLGHEKSVDLLIDGQKDIIKNHKNCKLVIIGDGPDAGAFRKQVIKNKLENNVIFTGKVPWEDVSRYYQLANVFATASRTETQGLTVIEAMAASTPVVCVNDESFRDVIVEGLNGFLFKNKRQYVKDIELLLDDSALLVKMGKQARILSETHSSKYFAEKVLDVYNIAIGVKQPAKKTFLKRFMKVLKGGFNGK